MYKSWWGFSASLLIVFIIGYSFISQVLKLKQRDSLNLLVFEEDIQQSIFMKESKNGDIHDHSNNFNKLEDKLNSLFTDHNHQQNINSTNLNFTIAVEKTYYDKLNSTFEGLLFSLKKYKELKIGLYEVQNYDLEIKLQPERDQDQYYFSLDDEYKLDIGDLGKNEFIEIHLMYKGLKDKNNNIDNNNIGGHTGDHRDENDMGSNNNMNGMDNDGENSHIGGMYMHDGEISEYPHGHGSGMKRVHLEKIENYILFIFDNGYPTLDNYNQPFKKYEDTITVPIPDQDEKVLKEQNRQTSNLFNLNFQLMDIKTDHGYVYNDIEEQKEVMLDSMQESSKINYNQHSNQHYNMLIISIKLNSNKIIYKRSYSKLIDFASMMGGLVSVLILVGRNISKPLAKLSFQASLLNELLEFEFEQKNKKQEKKQKEKMSNYKNQFSQKESVVIYTNNINNNNNHNNNKSDQQSSMFKNSIYNTDMESQINNNSNFSNVRPSQAEQKLNRQLEQIEETLRKNEDLILNEKKGEQKEKQTIVLTKNGSDNNLNLIKDIIQSTSSKKIQDRSQNIPRKKKSIFENLTEQLTHVKKQQTNIHSFQRMKTIQKFQVKKKLSQIEEHILSLFKSVVMHLNTFNMKFKDYVALINPFDKSIRKKAFEYSVKCVYNRMDISYILQKLNEIDKLKMILLDKDQRNLLEYWPREVFKEQEFINKKYQNKGENSEGKDNFDENYSILAKKQNEIMKFELSKQAFHNIQHRINEKVSEKIQENSYDTQGIIENLDQWDLNDRIDVKLYHALDQKTIHYFGCMENFQIIEENNKLRINHKQDENSCRFSNGTILSYDLFQSSQSQGFQPHINRLTQRGLGSISENDSNANKTSDIVRQIVEQTNLKKLKDRRCSHQNLNKKHQFGKNNQIKRFNTINLNIKKFQSRTNSNLDQILEEQQNNNSKGKQKRTDNSFLREENSSLGTSSCSLGDIDYEGRGDDCVKMDLISRQQEFQCKRSQ